MFLPRKSPPSDNTNNRARERERRENEKGERKLKSAYLERFVNCKPVTYVCLKDELRGPEHAFERWILKNLKQVPLQNVRALERARVLHKLLHSLLVFKRKRRGEG